MRPIALVRRIWPQSGARRAGRVADIAPRPLRSALPMRLRHRAAEQVVLNNSRLFCRPLCVNLVAFCNVGKRATENIPKGKHSDYRKS
jgi:hypothetical protein